MTIISALAVTAALAAGTAGAVTAYQLASPEPTSAPTAAVASNDDRSGPDRQRFAPCEMPAKLEHGRCVRDVTRTVVVPQPAPAAPERHRDDSGVAGSDDARRDFDDDELAVVADDDFDDDFDDFDTGTRTRTRTGHAAGTGTNTNTGGSGLSTSTRTRTGHSGTSG